MTARPEWAGPLAALCAGVPAYVLLGLAVSHRPPGGLDAAARGIAGEAPGVALIFTASCWWPVLTAFAFIGAAVAWRYPSWRARVVFAVAVTLIGWQLSDVLKNVFRRPRPTYWYAHHESSFAYSSGHAMFVVLVYWLWAYFIARTQAPPALRAGISALLTIWGGAILWSRLALGAHYPSDLAGGIVLGVCVLSTGLLATRVFAPSAPIP